MKDGHLNLSLHVPFLFYFVFLNRFSACEKFLSSPQHPDQLWDQSSLMAGWVHVMGYHPLLASCGCLFSIFLTLFRVLKLFCCNWKCRSVKMVVYLWPVLDLCNSSLLWRAISGLDVKLLCCVRQAMFLSVVE
jgi:hypothetical protein